MLDRPSGTTRKEHIPSPNKSLESYKTSPSRPHSSGGLGLERSSAAFAAGSWACDLCGDGCTPSGCGRAACCAQGLTRWTPLHPGHPAFSVKTRYDECHDPAKIQWYEGPAACERATSSDRQQQPVFRSAVCAVQLHIMGATRPDHPPAQSWYCAAHKQTEAKWNETQHTDRSDKGTPVNARRHDDAALSGYQRRGRLSVCGRLIAQGARSRSALCLPVHLCLRVCSRVASSFPSSARQCPLVACECVCASCECHELWRHSPLSCVFPLCRDLTLSHSLSCSLLGVEHSEQRRCKWKRVRCEWKRVCGPRRRRVDKPVAFLSRQVMQRSSKRTNFCPLNLV